MGEVLSLIALGVGYIVYLNASKEKESVRFFGQAISVLIMVGAVLMLVCSSMMCVYKKGCPFMGMKGQCPPVNCPMSGNK